ncbi:response regulator [Simiduia aestuariiviva]|uniref:CheY-like chemotaxis protein n=1 Tax=Simiduia aestuariiviva TaxID=1510459 RepID=A0A839UN60_9GAMM|nr:response regulator [Simiduia aestuariiviva]MBB3169604.1 CheY-like chemotaxis protein [Simiduia aestuariiviva]
MSNSDGLIDSNKDLDAVGHQGKSVLVVDDSFANLKLVCLLLKGEGYNIQTAMGADEALEVLETFLPDLILMDIQLPGVDGLTLTRQIKKDPRFKDVVVVALTAYAMKGDDERARESGCAGYITKPIDTRDFVATMSQFLPTDKGPR